MCIHYDYWYFFSSIFIFIFCIFILFICLLLRAWQTVPTCFDLFEIVAYFFVQSQNELPFDCRFFNCNRILSQLLINVLIFRNFPTSFSRSFSVWAATQPILTHTHTHTQRESQKALKLLLFGLASFQFAQTWPHFVECGTGGEGAP